MGLLLKKSLELKFHYNFVTHKSKEFAGKTPVGRDTISSPNTLKVFQSKPSQVKFHQKGTSWLRVEAESSKHPECQTEVQLSTAKSYHTILWERQ